MSEREISATALGTFMLDEHDMGLDEVNFPAWDKDADFDLLRKINDQIEDKHAVGVVTATLMNAVVEINVRALLAYDGKAIPLGKRDEFALRMCGSIGRYVSMKIHSLYKEEVASAKGQTKN